MSRNLLAPRKHYVSAYKNDICISHKGFDNLASALAEFAAQKEVSVNNYCSVAMASFNGNVNFSDDEKAPDHIVFWKGSRKKPFATYTPEKLEFDGARFVPRGTV
jgi:hypothetical protein